MLHKIFLKIQYAVAAIALLAGVSACRRGQDAVTVGDLIPADALCVRYTSDSIFHVTLPDGQVYEVTGGGSPSIITPDMADKVGKQVKREGRFQISPLMQRYLDGGWDTVTFARTDSKFIAADSSRIVCTAVRLENNDIHCQMQVFDTKGEAYPFGDDVADVIDPAVWRGVPSTACIVVATGAQGKAVKLLGLEELACGYDPELCSALRPDSTVCLFAIPEGKLKSVNVFNPKSYRIADAWEENTDIWHDRSGQPWLAMFPNARVAGYASLPLPLVGGGSADVTVTLTLDSEIFKLKLTVKGDKKGVGVNDLIETYPVVGDVLEMLSSGKLL